MGELIIDIAPEKEALIKEIVTELGGRVIETPKKKAGKKKEIKKSSRKEKIDHTFLFGKWKDFDIDPRKLREELWRRP